MSLRLQPALWAGYSADLKESFIRSSDFLNHVLKAEIPHFLSELEGRQPLSSDAHRYIAGEVKRVGPIAVSIELETTTAELVNNAMKQTNVVRDAFFNRLLLLLRSRPQLLRHMGVPISLGDLRFSDWKTVLGSISPVERLKEAVHDPLYFVRESLLENGNDGPYLHHIEIKFNDKPSAFATCYLEPHEVPDSEEKRKWDTEIEDLIL